MPARLHKKTLALERAMGDREEAADRAQKIFENLTPADATHMGALVYKLAVSAEGDRYIPATGEPEDEE